MLIDIKQDLDEQLQEQLRRFKKRAKADAAHWYKVQNAVARARAYMRYHTNVEDIALPDLFDDERGDPMQWYRRHDPEKKQVEMLASNLRRSRSYTHPRGRVTPYKLKNILKEILARRVEEYEKSCQSDVKNMEKKKIMCIVGASGAGKTLASLHLQNHKGANVICSYTTRPPRATEVEGREHHFIDILPDRTEVLAYVHFGQFYYYALKSQVYGPCTVYVIDERGLENLRKDCGDEYDIYSVLIKRRFSQRVKGVKGAGGIARIRRDELRDIPSEENFDYVVDNSTSKVHLFDEIERIYDEIVSK